MEKIELMHSIYGKREGYKCRTCNRFGWKIAGNGKDRHIAFTYCEVYGINKNNVNETDWEWDYPACGFYNLQIPPVKDVYKLANSSKPHQLNLFQGEGI